MTTTIDEAAAEALARHALSGWGAGPQAELAATALSGGWRFRVCGEAGDATTAGGSDAVVRAADGAVLRVPVGATDDAVARLLRPA